MPHEVLRLPTADNPRDVSGDLSAVEQDRARVGRVQLCRLLGRERDEGRDEEGDAAQDQGRKPRGERLACPCRLDHED
eukprot:scaffold94808_cov21-Phaeocystis_antarctica.AAC.1